MNALRVGTRGSLLARTQSQWVCDQLGSASLTIISTRGDQLVDLPLQSNLEKGLFTKELEIALLSGSIDLAVHSIKDLPVQPPPGLRLIAPPPRESAADLLILKKGQDPYASGMRIGTSSARRAALTKAIFPAANTVAIRGNVPTRIDKLRRGDADAILLAEAGISRLGLPLLGYDVFRLDPRHWVPAAGQGALGLEIRAEDDQTEALLTAIGDPATDAAVRLERAALEAFGGGCHSAFGAFAQFGQSGWTLHLGAATPDGFRCASLDVDEQADGGEILGEFERAAAPVHKLELTVWKP